MNKPDFKTMSRQQLHDYFMNHRDDKEAFYAYVDKLHTEGNWVEMPPLESVDDLNEHPNFIKRNSR